MYITVSASKHDIPHVAEAHALAVQDMLKNSDKRGHHHPSHQREDSIPEEQEYHVMVKRNEKLRELKPTPEKDDKSCIDKREPSKSQEKQYYSSRPTDDIPEEMLQRVSVSKIPRHSSDNIPTQTPALSLPRRYSDSCTDKSDVEMPDFCEQGVVALTRTRMNLVEVFSEHTDSPYKKRQPKRSKSKERSVQPKSDQQDQCTEYVNVPLNGQYISPNGIEYVNQLSHDNYGYHGNLNDYQCGYHDGSYLANNNVGSREIIDTQSMYDHDVSEHVDSNTQSNAGHYYTDQYGYYSNQTDNHGNHSRDNSQDSGTDSNYGNYGDLDHSYYGNHSRQSSLDTVIYNATDNYITENPYGQSRGSRSRHHENGQSHADINDTNHNIDIKEQPRARSHSRHRDDIDKCHSNHTDTPGYHRDRSHSNHRDDNQRDRSHSNHKNNNGEQDNKHGHRLFSSKDDNTGYHESRKDDYYKKDHRSKRKSPEKHKKLEDITYHDEPEYTYGQVEMCVKNVIEEYMPLERAQRRLAKEDESTTSQDGISDGDTTTSGSYIVDAEPYPSIHKGDIIGRDYMIV